MNATLHASVPAYPRLRRFTIDLGITAVFNVIIAIVITYAIGYHSSFLVNLVISMCIGTLMVTMVDGGRLVLWGNSKPPILPFALLFIVALPTSQFIGNELASLLLGIPSERFAEVRSQNLAGFAVLLFLICLTITLFFWNRGRVEMLKAEAEAEKARAAAIEKQAMQAQLQMLQAQIEPHMLFNTLANLQALIGVDPARAQHMLDQLIQYLRATLLSSRSEKTTLAHEFALMDAYLGLMKVRMGARLDSNLDLPQELRQAIVPPMLLQPLVENAIKHGLEPKVDGGRVSVNAWSGDGMLVLTVADTGLGLDAALSHATGTHVGVANIRERLHALYGDGASFSLSANKPSGAIAEIRIPL